MMKVGCLKDVFASCFSLAAGKCLGGLSMSAYVHQISWLETCPETQVVGWSLRSQQLALVLETCSFTGVLGSRPLDLGYR